MSFQKMIVEFLWIFYFFKFRSNYTKIDLLFKICCKIKIKICSDKSVSCSFQRYNTRLSTPYTESILYPILFEKKYWNLSGHPHRVNFHSPISLTLGNLEMKYLGFWRFSLVPSIPPSFIKFRCYGVYKCDVTWNDPKVVRGSRIEIE